MKKKLVPIYLLIIAMTAASCKKEEQTTEEPTNTPTSALLKNTQTGDPFNAGTVNDFTLAYTNNEVVLLAANNTTGKIYAVALNDGDASKASENAWTGAVSDAAARIASQMGASMANFRVYHMEVNPVSKSVYILVGDAQAQVNSLFKITKGGAEITPVNLDNVTYSTITFASNGEVITDLTWGDNTLYLGYSHPTTVAGQIATAQAPFQHNASMTSRATTVFKSNWGGQYFTDAPLETMAYGEVGGKKRLMGVTVCAPGYSFETSAINQGSGLLQVREYFNLNGGIAYSVFCMNNGTSDYLVEHHQGGRLTRVGKKYIDESQANFNANAPALLEFSGVPSPGMTDEDVRVLRASDVALAAKYSGSQVLIMTNTGEVSLITI